MNIERSILISFLGNYIINTVVAAVVALVPAATKPGILTAQYLTYVILAAIAVGIFTWWYGARSVKAGAIFGLIGFVVALVVAFISGVAGVMAQTGSISQALGVVPNFGPFLANWSTLFLLGYWVIPGALVGWWMSRSGGRAPMM